MRVYCLFIGTRNICGLYPRSDTKMVTILREKKVYGIRENEGNVSFSGEDDALLPSKTKSVIVLVRSASSR